MTQIGKTLEFLEILFQKIRRRQRDAETRGEADANIALSLSGSALAHKAGQLLAERSQASGIRFAEDVLRQYSLLTPVERTVFLGEIARGFCPDPDRIRRALADYDAAPGPVALGRVSHAAEAPRQELLRRLNQAPDGTAALVAMRADLLAALPRDADLAALDDDFVHLLRSWFNRGFLVMRRIDWSSPADLLERIIRYEAVHSITNWDDLRGRLLPADRRCYGFFHPALGDDPLIFVEVALCRAMPDSIQALLSPDRLPLDGRQAKVAVFYSISNCQAGLAGISFGQFLIKQVVEDLSAEFAGLESYVTLSPIPGLCTWLRSAGAPAEPKPASLMAMAARYLVRERDARDRLLDPVARFHVGNGARVERLCWMADTSARGLAQSRGIMVNYRYDLANIEANHSAYARQGSVATSPAVDALLDAATPPASALPDQPLLPVGVG
jgi:malonyl-CoA decarboxylase